MIYHSSMINITLLWNPKSTQNSYWMRGKIKYMKKEAKFLKKSYILQCKQQYNWKLIEKQVYTMIKIYFWDKRRRDWDNYHKLSMDSLEWTILKDDCQINMSIVSKKYDKNNPRIEICIYETKKQFYSNLWRFIFA